METLREKPKGFENVQKVETQTYPNLWMHFLHHKQTSVGLKSKC